MNSKNDPVFIVGMPRSGTTLLTTILNASNQIYFPEETHFYELLNKFNHFKINRYKFQSFQKYFFNPKSNQYLTSLLLSKNEIDKFTETSLGINEVKSILEDICILKANKKGIYRWGEKTPIHFLYVDEILNQFPNAKIINLIRDPRDVIYSLKNLKWKKQTNIYLYLKHWKISYNLKFKKKYKGKIITIRFEDLLLFPKENISKILSFINIETKNDLINDFEKKENINFSIDNEPWKLENLKTLNILNVYKWKRREITMQDNFISWYLKNQIMQLNYEKGNNEISLKLISFCLYLKLSHIILISFFYLKRLMK